MTVETRYFRSDEHTVNGLTAKKLLNTSDTAPSAYTGEIWADTPKVASVYFEFNIRHADGSLTYLNAFQKTYSEEIDQDVIVEVSIPLRSLQPDDAIQVEVIFDVGGTEYMHEFFITEQLNAWRLNNATWKVVYHIYYWKNYVEGNSPPWVTIARFSPERIEDFAYDEPVNFSKTVSDAIGVSDVIEKARVAWRKTLQECVKLSDLMNTLKTSGGAPENWLSGWQYRKKHEIDGSSAGAVADYQIRIKVHYGEGTDSSEDVYLRSEIYNVESGSWNISGNTYKYRLKITITEKAGQNLTDYQVKVVVNTKQLVDKGYATSSGSEVRFADDQGNLLSFWRENAFNQEETAYWVKVLSIPANSEVAIYMYFDPDLTEVPDASDGDATFILFDDFSTKDADKWNWPSDWDIETGYAKQTYSGNWPPSDRMWSLGDLNVPISDSVGVIIETYAKNLGTASAYDMLILWDNDNDHSTVSGVNVAVGSYDHWHEWGTSTANANWGEPDERNWHEYQVILFDGDWRLIIDGTQYSTHAGSITKLAAVGFSSKGQSYWDWMRVRKYVDPEPEAKPETITAEKCRADFGDIRFTASDGVTLLDYWMEEKVDGDYAIFWIKVPNIPADPGKAVIYIYYGNPDATYDGDPEQVFDFYEDFSSDPNSNGKWEVYRRANDTNNEFVYDSANKRVYLTKAVGNRGCFAFLKKNGSLLDCPEPGFAVKTRGGGGGGSGADGWAFGFYKDPSPYQTYGRASGGGSLALAAYDGSTNHQSKGYAVEFDNFKGGYDPSANHNALVDTLTTINPETHHARKDTNIANEDNVTHDIEIYVYNGAKLVVDGSEHFSCSMTLDKTYAKMGFGAATGGSTNNHWIQDYVIVRKYVDPEPSHGTWYAEEEYMPAVNYELMLAEAVGACDAYSRSWSAIRPLPDQIGAYDAVTPLRRAGKLIKDYVGLFDSFSKHPASLRADSLAALDAYATVKSLYRHFLDAVGMHDYKFFAVEARLSDLVALYDMASRHPASYIGDFINLSDRFSSYIFGKVTLADGIGLYDSFTKAFTAYRTYSEPLGVYDALLTVKAQFRSFAELIDLVDVVAKSSSFMRSELISLSDVIEKVFTAYREYVDDIGLLDTVSKQPLRALVDRAGLYDVASKAVSRRVEDSAALSDLVERHPAAIVADSISLYDAYVREWTAHKEVVDVVGLLDVLTPVKALFEVFSEPVALADVFTRKWDIKREYFESAGLYDEVTRRWGKWILLTESIAAYDEEYLLRLRKAVARILSPKRILPAFREQPPDRVQGPGSE